MPDPFLAAHAIGYGVYSIAGRLYPISIRDQMVRAQMLIERAVTHTLLRPGMDSLLVIGAGAAGVAAALTAARLHIQTFLVDRDSGPFLRQAMCRTRWIDPTVYDWPALHAFVGHYPLARWAPLQWAADWANRLAMQWGYQLNAARALYPHLHVEYNTLPLPPQRTGQVWSVPIQTPAGQSTITASVLLWAVGYGTERCNVDQDYQGFGFWQSDPFQHPIPGLSPPHQPQILISGSGDGALQDFLRLTTIHTSPQTILRQCNFGSDTLC